MLKVQIDIHHNTVLFVQKNSVNDTSLIFKKNVLKRFHWSCNHVYKEQTGNDVHRQSVVK